MIRQVWPRTMNYLAIEQQVRALKQQVAAGELEPQLFEARLLEMMAVGDDGYYWMFGHKSESWYRHDGQRWVPASPGELLISLDENGLGAKPSRTTNHQAISYLHRPQPEIFEGEWGAEEGGWFTASLAFLGFIAVVVYMATSRL
jgi:hypothetical protein